MKTLDRLLQEKLQTLHTTQAYRRIRIQPQNSPFASLWTNDYLGLSNDHLLRERFWDTVGRHLPFGSTGSPLLSGHHRASRRFSLFLENEYQKKPILFGSGWQANTGFIEAFSQLFGPRLAWVADEHVHASMISGFLQARHYGSRFYRFRHQNAEHAQSFIERIQRDVDIIILCQESIYSMDGDALAVRDFAKLTHHEKVLWWVDEAHAVGIFGPHGRGWTQNVEREKQPDFLTITFGKALASHGAALLSPFSYAPIFVNFARSLIYSTASAPIQVAWTHWIWEKVIQHPRWSDRLHKLSARLGNWARVVGFAHQSQSPILPLVLGTNEKVLQARALWNDAGWTVAAIRPPTVPPHKARLRLSITRNLRREHLCLLKDLIDKTAQL